DGAMRRALECVRAVCVWCCVLVLSHGYNLDTRSAERFGGPAGSMFGYSVLLHKNQQSTWLIAGAPTDDSKFYPDVKKPGAVYKCNISNKKCDQLRAGVDWCGKTCKAESDNQWLGVSLSRRSSSGEILACGHRWKNIFFSSKDNQNKLPHGVCFKFSSTFSRTRHYIPCYRDHQRRFGEDYGSCQAGISNFLTDDLVIMGAPGSSYWTGSVLVYNTSSNMSAAYVDDESAVLYGSYLGEAHFLYTVNAVHQLPTMHCREHRSDALYFRFQANMKEAGFKLVGSDSYAARFGETITDLGDIDNDGYPDVAIGAPQEEELRGAVYIYNGRKSGISSSFSQRITGSVSGYALSMFGQSVSGGIDVDGNGYPGNVSTPSLCIATIFFFSRWTKDVRDIFTLIQFEVQYELGEHSVFRGGTSRTFSSLQPILQQREGHTNLVSNQTQFARYCAWENCSTNLQVSARLVLPQNMSYFALGNGKTILLNATLINAGDDAFLPKLHLRYPSNLHFIRVLDAEEKYVSCEVVEENKTAIGLDCSVANLYIPSLTKINISFLMDVIQNSSAGDISISINATRTIVLFLHDNLAGVPIRSGQYDDLFLIMIHCLNVLIIYSCFMQCHCRPKNSSLWLEDDCDVRKASFIQELIFFFSKSSKRVMFCAQVDGACMVLECNFGNLDPGKEVTINLEVELNPAVLQISPVRVSQTNSLSNHSTVFNLNSIIQNIIFRRLLKLMENLEILVPPRSLVFCLISKHFILWAGFFKRRMKEHQEKFKRDSWDYVPKCESVS
uniref:Integrin alpha 4 n=1 Tax=Astyanax mexicanus TaxID=7994 RepID=A0A8B9LPM4_ASTMX